MYSLIFLVDMEYENEELCQKLNFIALVICATGESNVGVDTDDQSPIYSIDSSQSYRSDSTEIYASKSSLKKYDLVRLLQFKGKRMDMILSIQTIAAINNILVSNLIKNKL